MYVFIRLQSQYLVTGSSQWATHERGIQSENDQAESNDDHGVCRILESLQIYPFDLRPSAFTLVPDIDRWRYSCPNGEPRNGEHGDLYEEQYTHRPAEADSRDQALNHDWKAHYGPKLARQ